MTEILIDSHAQPNVEPDLESPDFPALRRTRALPAFEEADLSERCLERINEIAPKPLASDDVYVRSMFLCSSEVCESDGCKFTRNALSQIASLIIGQSVLTGHDRRSLPVARFYHAAVVEGKANDGEPTHLVRAWFYWLRETSGAKDLLLNIDGGIYREVSLAWRYRDWTCSVCGEPNGRCAHRVGETYHGEKCHRVIDEALDVLEGSLVYKSADRNTFLAGARESRPVPEDGYVALLCMSNDPLLERLRSFGAIEDAFLLADAERCFADAVDQMWIRQTDGKPMAQERSGMLTDHSQCLIEAVSNMESNSFFGNATLFVDGKESPLSCVVNA